MHLEIRLASIWPPNISEKLAVGLRIALALVLVGAPLLASAQVSAGANSGAPGSQVSPSILQEVVVTATTKSGQSLADSAIAATVVSANALVQNEILTTQDLTAVVPSLLYETAQDRSLVYIRGVGSSFALAGAESSVATYQDGAYMPRQGGDTLGLLDVANVQVLRGPQAVLYGSNATGGAIVVNTQDPTHAFGGDVQVGGGNLGYYRAEGVVNVPISPTLAVRVAASGSGLGEWVTNVGSPGKDMGGDWNYDVRGKALWTPSTHFDTLLEVESTSDTNDSYGQHARADAPCTGCALGDVPVAPTNFYTISTNDRAGPFLYGDLGDHGSYVQTTLALLRMRYHADNLDVENVTAWNFERNLSRSDNDISEAEAFFARVDEVGPTFEDDVFAQSNFNGPVNGLIGASYEDDTDHQPTNFAGFFYAGLEPGQTQTATVKATSVYGNLYYEFLPHLKLTVGARYTDDRKSLVTANDAEGALVSGGLTGYSENHTYVYTTPQAILGYQAHSGYYYAKYSEGERAGFFTTPSFTPVAALEPERLNTFEIGAKNRFFNDRLRTDADIFEGKFSDMIVEYDDPAAGGIRAQNAAAARQYGLETDAAWLATDRLSFNLAFDYLRAYFMSFNDAAVVGVVDGALANETANLTGSVVPRAPKLSGSLGGAYVAPVFGGWTATTSLNLSYQSGYDFYADGGGPLGFDRQNATALVNGSLRFTSPNGTLFAQLWVKNLTNKEYYLDAETDTFAAHYIAALPRTFGGTVGLQF